MPWIATRSALLLLTLLVRPSLVPLASSSSSDLFETACTQLLCPFPRLQAGAAAQQCGAPSRRRGGGAEEPPLPDLPTALAAAHAAVARAAPDNELVEAGEALVTAYQNGSDVLDLGAATQALEALALVEAATEGDAYRGAVLLERGNLLETLVRPEASQAALELAARLLQKQGLPEVQRAGGPGGAGYEPARAVVSAQDAYTTAMQRWVIGRLLRVRAARRRRRTPRWACTALRHVAAACLHSCPPACPPACLSARPCSAPAAHPAAMDQPVQISYLCTAQPGCLCTTQPGSLPCNTGRAGGAGAAEPGAGGAVRSHPGAPARGRRGAGRRGSLHRCHGPAQQAVGWAPPRPALLAWAGIEGAAVRPPGQGASRHGTQTVRSLAALPITALCLRLQLAAPALHPLPLPAVPGPQMRSWKS